MTKLQRLILFSVLLMTLPAHAGKLLRGAWYSSGDLGMPAEVTYEFEYACQAEVANSEFPNTFMVARFSLRNDVRSVSSTDLTWQAVEVMDEIDERPLAEAPFTVDGAIIAFSVGSVESEVSIFTSLSIATGTFKARNFETAPFHRDDVLVYANNTVDLTDLKDYPVRSVSMQVICDKVK